MNSKKGGKGMNAIPFTQLGYINTIHDNLEDCAAVMPLNWAKQTPEADLNNGIH